MAEQLDNSIQSLVAEQVDVQIHRLYQDTRDNWQEVCPTLSHQLTFLTLALKKESQKDSLEVWEQLIQLMQDICQWENKPNVIDLSVVTKVVELTTKLVSFRRSQPILGDTTRPERESRTLTTIALSCARKVLTFLIGEILCLQQLLPLVPRGIGSFFLDITLNEEILSTDENGEYYLLEHEVGELSHFILESSVNFYTNLLTNILALNKLLTLIHKFGQLQPCNPYPLKTIKLELASLVNKLEHLPRKDWTTAKLTNQEVQIQFRKTIRESRKIFWLTIPLPRNIIQEEVVWQANRVRTQNNLSVRLQESTNLASLLRQSQELNIIENQLVQPKESNNLANTSTQAFRRRRSRKNRRSARDNQSQRDEIPQEDFSVEDSIILDYTRGDSPINSRSDNSSRNRYVELDKQRQVLRTFRTAPQTLPDPENNTSPTIEKSNSSIAPVTDIKMNTPKFAAAFDLSAFQKDQHVRSGLQSLNSYAGGSLQRFDIWLETFEAMIVDSGKTKKDIVLELKKVKGTKKMSEKAQRIMKYILNSGDDSYKSIRERLFFR